MKISIVGSGYVGLVSAAGFAEHGHQVTCVDVVKEKVDLINNAKSPIYEKGLNDILEKTVGKNLIASLDLKKAVLETDITYICVGTPSDKDGSMDVKYVKQVASEIGAALKQKKDYHVVVVKSTVVPGTTEGTVCPILEAESGKKVGKDIGLGMNPEFLREGVAVDDFLEPDRVVIGACDERAAEVIESNYGGFDAPIMLTNCRSAEMIKYCSNSLLATKISFINEIGNICKKLDIDVYEVADGMGLDHRINRQFLNAGLGFGGSCFPKDVRALRHKARILGVEHTLLDAVLDVNDQQPQRFMDVVHAQVGPLKGKKVALLGLAFKADTDDLRESRALVVLDMLLAEGANVVAFDPEAIENTKQGYGGKVTYAKSIDEALNGAEVALVVTEWKEFSNLDVSKMKYKIVFDARRIVNPSNLPQDCVYEGMAW